VAGTREFVEAQITGRMHLIAGVLQLPPLQETNVFSDVVAKDTLWPAVLVEN
jgi:hypothetical protein